MPTYVYDCPQCGTFEVQQRMADAALTQCPDCQSPVKRNVTFCALVMKDHERADYFAGREGDKKMKRQAQQNACVARGVKAGEYDEPKRGEDQPMSSFKDLEARLK